MLLHIILQIAEISNERILFLVVFVGVYPKFWKGRYSSGRQMGRFKGWKNSPSLFTWKKISLLYFFEIPVNYFHTQLVPSRLLYCVETSRV